MCIGTYSPATLYGCCYSCLYTSLSLWEALVMHSAVKLEKKNVALQVITVVITSH